MRGLRRCNHNYLSLYSCFRVLQKSCVVYMILCTFCTLFVSFKCYHHYYHHSHSPHPLIHPSTHKPIPTLKPLDGTPIWCEITAFNSPKLARRSTWHTLLEREVRSAGSGASAGRGSVNWIWIVFIRPSNILYTRLSDLVWGGRHSSTWMMSPWHSDRVVAPSWSIFVESLFKHTTEACEIKLFMYCSYITNTHSGIELR